jgi:hypothetical protein
MTPQEYEINQLRHDLARAETEIRETRKKLIDEIIAYSKLDHITLKDLIRIMRGMK